MKRISRFIIPVIVGITTLLSTGCFAEPAVDAKSAVDEKSAEVLDRMSAFLDQQPRLRMEVTDTIEKEDDDNVLIQYTHERVLTVQRPNQVRVDVQGDLETQTVVYDGTALTVWIPTQNVYAQEKSPGTINETLEMLSKNYGLRRPLSEFAYTGLSKRIQSNVLSGRYLGIHKAAGTDCHHLVFSSSNVDWQLWVDAGEAPVPRKILINYWSQPGQPRYSMEVDKIEFPGCFPEDTFKLAIPEDAEQIPFEPMVEVATGKDAK
jgi:hypothetical protein